MDTYILKRLIYNKKKSFRCECSYSDDDLKILTLAYIYFISKLYQFDYNKEEVEKAYDEAL